MMPFLPLKNGSAVSQARPQPEQEREAANRGRNKGLKEEYASIRYVV